MMDTNDWQVETISDFASFSYANCIEIPLENILGSIFQSKFAKNEGK